MFIIFILLINLLATPKGFCANFDNEFVTNFYRCTPYYQVEGSRIRQIIGWANSRCNYREIVSKGVIDCQFKQGQVHEIALAMRYDRKSPPLAFTYPDGEVKVYDTGSLAGNIWSKYIYMKGTCNADLKEFDFK